VPRPCRPLQQLLLLLLLLQGACVSIAGAHGRQANSGAQCLVRCCG
jgi:hypothetical protein